MAKRKSWAARIEAAEKRGKFTDYEVALASDSWLSCAVGEKHNWPSTYYKLTEEEEWLGLDFGYAVSEEQIQQAKFLYEEIQALP